MLKKIGIILALFGAMCIAQAQQSLGALAAEAGVDWILGSWQTTSDSGDVILLEFKADLDNHIGFIHYKDARSESKGIVLVDPNSTDVKYYSGNNRGAVGTGTWTVEDGKPVLRYKQTSAEGDTQKMGMVFSKVNANSMEINIYELNDQDQLGDEARFTATFKRKK